ncbi:MAG: hypothetical protein ACYST6_14660, partial [Planctomycetota bacterium]
SRDISERMRVENDLRAQIMHLRNEYAPKKDAFMPGEQTLLTPLVALKEIISDARTGAFGEISPELRESLELAHDYVESASRALGNLDDKATVASDPTGAP